MNNLNNASYFDSSLQWKRCASCRAPNDPSNTTTTHANISSNASFLFPSDSHVSTTRLKTSTCKTKLTDAILNLRNILRNDVAMLTLQNNQQFIAALQVVVGCIGDQDSVLQIGHLAYVLDRLCDFLKADYLTFKPNRSQAWKLTIEIITNLTACELVIHKILRRRCDVLLNVLVVLSTQCNDMMKQYNNMMKQDRKVNRNSNDMITQDVSRILHATTATTANLAVNKRMCNDIAFFMDDAGLCVLFAILFNLLSTLLKNSDMKDANDIKIMRDVLITLSRLVVTQNILKRLFAIYGDNGISKVCDILTGLLEANMQSSSKQLFPIMRDAATVIICLTNCSAQFHKACRFLFVSLNAATYGRKNKQKDFSTAYSTVKVIHTIAQCGDTLKFIDFLKADDAGDLSSLLISLLPDRAIGTSCKDPRIILGVIMTIAHLALHKPLIITSMGDKNFQVLFGSLVGLMDKYSNMQIKIASLIVCNTLTAIRALTERAQLLTIRHTSCIDFQYLLCMLCKLLCQYSQIKTKYTLPIMNNLLMTIVNLTDHIDAAIEQQITSMTPDDFSQAITNLISVLDKDSTTNDEAKSAMTTNLVIIITNLVANMNICKKITSMNKTHFFNLMDHLIGLLARYRENNANDELPIMNELLIAIDSLINPDGDAIAKQTTPQEKDAFTTRY